MIPAVLASAAGSAAGTMLGESMSDSGEEWGFDVSYSPGVVSDGPGLLDRMGDFVGGLFEGGEHLVERVIDGTQDTTEAIGRDAATKLAIAIVLLPLAIGAAVKWAR